jgi:hypothetical protein
MMPIESKPYQLIVRLSGPPQHARYEVCWLDGNDALGGRNGVAVSQMLPPLDQIFIDVMPFLAARLLLYRGHDPLRLLIVTLEGADYELARAPLVCSPQRRSLMTQRRSVTRSQLYLREFGSMKRMIEMTVEDQGGRRYRVRWHHYGPDDIFLADIPEQWLDLIGFMVARKLAEYGYNSEQLLVVKLQGVDYDLMRTSLGSAAATPKVNFANPVTEPARCIYKATS